MVGTKWSKNDEKFLVDNYYTTKLDELSKELGRTISSIRLKAKGLGLYRSKQKMVQYHPEANSKIKEILGDYLNDLNSSRKKIQKWIDRIDKHEKINALDLTALANSMNSLNKSIETLAKLYKLVEKEETKIGTVNINMNIYDLMQTANEIMTPDQRSLYSKTLKDKGIVEEVMKP